jgi:GNAT superfamily N-acetyltransferase
VINILKLPVALSANTQEFTLRRASEDDLAALMRLLADDPFSATRGDKADEVDAVPYSSALTAIVSNPSNELLVAVSQTNDPLAMMQLTRIPGMTRRGSTRLLVEAVRVRSDYRSSGIGTSMMRWVTGTAAPAVEASLVQLTSDEARQDAHRFYERLGFINSHRGFKYEVGWSGLSPHTRKKSLYGTVEDVAGELGRSLDGQPMTTHDAVMESRHVSRVIKASPAAVYEYAVDVGNLPLWAVGLARAGVVRDGDLLLVDSPMGQVEVRFVERNQFGVLDHDVRLPSGTVVTNSVRVIAHPEGAEVVFTVRQIELDDDEFARDIDLVAADLERLERQIVQQT